MAFNPSPEVASCRALARKWRMDAVVVVALNTSSGKFMTVSYGETLKLCNATRQLANSIHDMISDGDLPLPQ